MLFSDLQIFLVQPYEYGGNLCTFFYFGALQGEDFMFYDNIYKICRDKGTSPTVILKELGYSTGNVSKWKSSILNGRVYSPVAVKKISDFLHIPDAESELEV